MVDNNKAKIAKYWITSLANGINPLDGTMIKDDDIVNNIHISRCLFYVAELIGSAIENNEKPKREKKQPFNITAEELNRVNITDKTWISNLVKEINAVIPENMKHISNNTITRWLVENGYLKEILTDSGAKIRRPTDTGLSIGISTEQREGANGPYISVVYNADAQRFILNNIYAIIEQP